MPRSLGSNFLLLPLFADGVLDTFYERFIWDLTYLTTMIPRGEETEKIDFSPKISAAA